MPKPALQDTIPTYIYIYIYIYICIPPPPALSYPVFCASLGCDFWGWLGEAWGVSGGLRGQGEPGEPGRARERQGRGREPGRGKESQGEAGRGRERQERQGEGQEGEADLGRSYVILRYAYVIIRYPWKSLSATFAGLGEKQKMPS